MLQGKYIPLPGHHLNLSLITYISIAKYILNLKQNLIILIVKHKFFSIPFKNSFKLKNFFLKVNLFRLFMLLFLITQFNKKGSIKLAISYKYFQNNSAEYLFKIKAIIYLRVVRYFTLLNQIMA